LGDDRQTIQGMRLASYEAASLGKSKAAQIALVGGVGLASFAEQRALPAERISQKRIGAGLIELGECVVVETQRSGCVAMLLGSTSTVDQFACSRDLLSHLPDFPNEMLHAAPSRWV
jgi:hypothetical protein